MEEIIEYRMATVEDVPVLVKMRAAFLAEVEDRPTRPELLAALSGYFSRAAASGNSSSASRSRAGRQSRQAVWSSAGTRLRRATSRGLKHM
jgi:hypothetical protein